MQFAESIDKSLAAKVLKSVANEEHAHMGEYLRLLYELTSEEGDAYSNGVKEVEDEIKKINIRISGIAANPPNLINSFGSLLPLKRTSCV